jgi:Mn-dependent DtxR family transcriptional regulator
MPNETEAMALALLRLLHEATDGDAMQWRTIRRLDGGTEGAVAFAAERGWLQHDDSGRVALTDAGREVAQALGRLLH